MFLKIGVLKIFASFTRKNLCWSPLQNTYIEWFLFSQLTFTCSKMIIETLERDVEDAQINNKNTRNIQHSDEAFFAKTVNS